MTSPATMSQLTTVSSQPNSNRLCRQVQQKSHGPVAAGAAWTPRTTC